MKAAMRRRRSFASEDGQQPGLQAATSRWAARSCACRDRASDEGRPREVSRDLLMVICRRETELPHEEEGFFIRGCPGTFK